MKVSLSLQMLCLFLKHLVLSPKEEVLLLSLTELLSNKVNLFVVLLHTLAQLVKLHSVVSHHILDVFTHLACIIL